MIQRMNYYGVLRSTVGDVLLLLPTLRYSYDSYLASLSFNDRVLIHFQTKHL